MESISPRDPDWQALLDRLPAYSPFLRPEWSYLLERYVPGYVPASFRIRRSAAVWILPGLARKRAFGQHSFLSLPFGTHGGIFGEEPLSPDLAQAVVGELSAQVAPWITITWPSSLEQKSAEMEDSAPHSTLYTLHSYSTHLLDLSRGFPTLWDEVFSGTLRTQIRKAESSEILVRRSTGKEVHHDFLRLYAAMSERRAVVLPFGPAFFGALFAQPWCRLYAARFQGEVVAVAVALVGKREAHWWQGVVDHSLRGLRPNRLLVARMIEDLCLADVRTLDLGGSEGEAGVAQFKRDFGAVERQVTQWRAKPRWAWWTR